MTNVGLVEGIQFYFLQQTKLRNDGRFKLFALLRTQNSYLKHKDNFQIETTAIKQSFLISLKQMVVKSGADKNQRPIHGVVSKQLCQYSAFICPWMYGWEKNVWYCVVLC